MADPITVNTYDHDAVRAREELILGALDAKRPTAWAQYGYPDEVTFGLLLKAYERGGPGHGAVHRILDKCWEQRPRIKRPEDDEESDWEKKVGEVLAQVYAWQKLRDFDRRNMVGWYSALIYRVADGKSLDQPLTRARELADLVPVYQDQIQVSEWHADASDPDTYGTPKMFQFKPRPITGASGLAGKPMDWVNVHPTRVQVLAEGSVGDFTEGVPLLKAGFNHLVDLEKISGGSAESFLKNSARTVVFEYAPEAAPQAIQAADGSTLTVRQVHEQQARNLNRNQDSSIVMQGGKATTLQTTVSDPTGAFQLAANLFAASVQIPFTILFGQQTGRLASDEDKADMVARCRSRQTNDLTPMLEQFVRRMQAAGILEAGEFEIEWPPLDAPGDDEKMTVLGKMTGAMQQAFQAGLTQPLFDANELRKVAGFEERADDGMPTEEDLRAAEEAEAAALAAKAQGQKQPAKA